VSAKDNLSVAAEQYIIKQGSGAGGLMPDTSFYSRLGRLSSIILILPSSMAGGWLLGYYLVDRYFSSFPWGTIILTMAGAGAGLFEIFRILNDDRRRSLDQSRKP